MNEHSFIKSIHSKITSEVFVWKIADKYQGGVPDTYYSGPSGYMFVEYKYKPKLPSKYKTKVKIELTKLQRIWLTRAQSHNHLAYIVLGTPAGVYVTDDITEKDITHERLLEEVVPKQDFITRIENVCLRHSTIL